jgi:hypothetical protein
LPKLERNTRKDLEMSEEKQVNEKAIQKVEPQGLEVFGAGFERAQRMAQALASSDMIPERFRNNIGSCLIALDMAGRLGFAPIAVMQKMYVVHGQPGFESTFVIAAVNSCGKYSRLRFVENGKRGDDFGVYAIASDLETGDNLKGTTITMSMVKAEGWLDKKGSKWKTMPEQMFKYRAAAFWVREFDPALIMGMPTTDEVIDLGTAEVVERKDPQRKPATTLDDVASELAKDDSGTPDHTDVDTDTRRQSLYEMAAELWGDDAMIRLAEMCRGYKVDGETKPFSVSSATVEQLEWAATEIDDRMAAREAENG